MKFFLFLCYFKDGSVEQYLQNGNYTNLHHEYCLESNESSNILKICFPEENEIIDDDSDENAPVDVVKAAYPIRE